MLRGMSKKSVSQIDKMIRNKQKILWLASWYPNRLAPFDGDFIQRHAEAVSLLYDVTVIFIKKDAKGEITEDVEKDVFNRRDGLEERIYYYKPKRTGIGFIDRILSVKKYHTIIRQAAHQYLADRDIPPLVHVHIASYAGLGALWLQDKYRVPFVISEHWTGYLPMAKPNVKNLDPLQKLLRRILFKRAKAVTVVSAVLGDAIQQFADIPPYTVIPNVVNTDIFNLNGHSSHTVNGRFIHISTLSEQKNLPAIIEGFRIVHAKHRDVQLMVYGPENPELEALILERGLEDVVIQKGEVSQKELADELRTCKSLIFYSRYETFGCVVIEANACGVPAIVSDLPVFHEYVQEGNNGVFVPLDSKVGLAQAILEVMEDEYRFDKKALAEEISSKFGYQQVAKQFRAVYQNVLGLSK